MFLPAYFLILILVDQLLSNLESVASNQLKEKAFIFCVGKKWSFLSIIYNVLLCFSSWEVVDISEFLLDWVLYLLHPDLFLAHG